MAKKKLTKQEKKKIEAEKAEALRIEIEKERQKQLEEERKKKIQELQEAKERQKREKRENKIRKIQLAESCEHFEKIREEIENIYTEIRKQKEWKRYMRCNGLPNAYDPGDLRKYLHMWCLSIDNYNQTEQNWLLQTDERSILTQNQLVSNRTRDNLQKQQSNLGDMYSERAVEVLGILNEIDEAITDPFTLSRSIIKDLNRLKYEFRSKLSEYIDQFSFKILSNIDRDMTLESLLIATHLYKSPIFKIHLWTKRDIPQPQLNEKERLKEAKKYIAIDFMTIKLNLCLPPAVKCKNSAIRAMWLNYDHFSDCCPSFTLPFCYIPNLDISIAARKEWKKRRELMKMAIEEKDNEKNNLELGAVPFDNLEHQPASSVIDVDKLYADYVAEKDKRKKALKGTEALNLKEFELNLRKYRIAGGIYCLEYVEQPEQNVKLTSNAYLRTIIGSNTLKRRQFFQYYRPPAPTPAGVRRLPEEVEAELKAIEKGLNKLAYITIVLPDDVMWFEPPTVCRWETPEETRASEKLENKRSESLYAAEEVSAFNTMTKKPLKIIEDFNLFDIPSSIDLHCVMKEFVVPRLPNGYTIKIQEKNAERKSSVFKIIHDEEDDLIKPVKPRTFQDIKEVLIPTHSPRPLHPKVVIKRPMKLIEKSTITTETENIGSCSYMFSKLISDLDELCDKQVPYVEKQIEEISDILSNISASAEEFEETPDASEKNFSEMSFIRGDDYPWNFQKKEEVIDENPSVAEDDEESKEDSIDLNSEDECVRIKDTDLNFGRWSIRDVHDPKFNEEKLAIQFRCGRLGYFGLAINWYCNLPYQTWELKPDTKETNTVIFSLTAAVVSIEISILANGITLNSFQGGNSSIVQNAIGDNMTFDKFKDILMQAGINLFPDDDAFCYCEAACEKNIVMETHLYRCMGYLGLTHNFMWSRWNILSNNRSAILLMREIFEQRKTPNFSTLLVTPLKACLVECTEVSTSFNSNPLDGMNFYADLYHLNEEHSNADSKEKQKNMNPMLRENVIQVLQTIRPLSFC